MAESSVQSASAKLMKQMENFGTMNEQLIADENVPAYAKAILQQVTCMLTFAKTLLDQQVQVLNKEDEQRQRCVVISGLPESNQAKATKRAQEDHDAVLEILDAAEIEVLPKAVYRMPLNKQPGNKPRLIKVELPTRRAAQTLARSNHKVKQAMRNQTIHIRPSMTPEELAERRQLVEECKKKRQANPDADFIVYAGKVILRSEIHIFRKKPGNS